MCRVVSLKGEPGWVAVDLTPCEYDWLNYLVTNAGRPIERMALLEAVFEIPGDGDTQIKTLEKHIWSLRQKIEPNPKEPKWIVNVREVGYKWDGSATVDGRPRRRLLSGLESER